MYVGYMITAIVTGCISITGITTNGISLYMFRRGGVKTATTYQLQCLAAVDLAFLLYVFIRWPISEALRQIFGSTLIPGAVDVYILTPLNHISYTASIWLTVFIALYRYLAICKPFTDSYRHVEKHGQKYAVLVLVMSTLFELPIVCLYILWHHDLITYQNFSHYFGITNYLDVIFLFIFPLITLTFLTVRLITAVKKREQIKKGMQRTQTPQDITNILIAILVTFLVCQFPNAVDKLCFVMHYEVDLTYPWWVNYLAWMLAAANSAANGFIYFFCNKHFRSELIAHCSCGRNAQNQDLEMATM